MPQIVVSGPSLTALPTALLPTGAPFNQLAALARDKNEFLDAVYYYQRRYVTYVARISLQPVTLASPDSPYLSKTVVVKCLAVGFSSMPAAFFARYVGTVEVNDLSG